MEPIEQINTAPEQKKDSNSVGDESEEQTFSSDDLKSRFYRNEWPKVGDLVIVEIMSVNNEGAYVRLLEYNNV